MTQFVLLWSKQENELHVEALERTLSLNRQSYREDEVVLYAPLAVGTEGEMNAIAAMMRRTTLKDRAA